MTYRRTADDLYVESLPNGEIIAFRVPPSESSKQSETKLLWGHKFTSPMCVISSILVWYLC